MNIEEGAIQMANLGEPLYRSMTLYFLNYSVKVSSLVLNFVEKMEKVFFPLLFAHFVEGNWTKDA